MKEKWKQLKDIQFNSKKRKFQKKKKINNENLFSSIFSWNSFKKNHQINWNFSSFKIRKNKKNRPNQLFCFESSVWTIWRCQNWCYLKAVNNERTQAHPITTTGNGIEMWMCVWNWNTLTMTAALCSVLWLALNACQFGSAHSSLLLILPLLFVYVHPPYGLRHISTHIGTQSRANTR